MKKLTLISAVILVTVSCTQRASSQSKPHSQSTSPKLLFGIRLGSHFEQSKLNGTQKLKETFFAPGTVLHGLAHVDFSIQNIPEPVASFSSYAVQTTMAGTIYGISAEGKAACKGDQREYLALLSTLIDKYGKPTQTKSEIGLGPSAEWTYQEKPRRYQLTLACWGNEVSIYLSDQGIIIDEAARDQAAKIAPEKAKINTNGL